MKLVVFGEALTYPPKEGITAHVFSFLESLEGSFIRPILVMADRGFIDRATIKEFRWPTYLIPPDMFYDYEKMERLLNELQPDALQSYNVYQARLIAGPYSLRNRIPLVMEHHDIESDLAKFLQLPGFAAKANTHAQQEVVSMASMNRVMSAHDLEALRSQSPDRADSFFLAPVGVKDNCFSADVSKKNRKKILFIGNGAYPPNRDAIKTIVEKIAPSMADFSFDVVGRMTEELVPENIPNVKGYGMVDDLSPFIARASCGVIPIAAGSGLKIKILTYISGGLPVVGTRVAFQGFEEAPFFCESSVEDFHKAIERMVTNDSYESISRQARSLFLKEYETHSVGKKVIDAYKALEFSPGNAAFNLQPIERNDANLAWIHEIREEAYPITKAPLYMGGVPG